MHDDQNTGRVRVATWRDGLHSVLQLRSVPLLAYRTRLAALEPDGTIGEHIVSPPESLVKGAFDGCWLVHADYNRFLNRFVLVQEGHSGWQTDVVKELYEAYAAHGFLLQSSV